MRGVSAHTTIHHWSALAKVTALAPPASAFAMSPGESAGFIEEAPQHMESGR
jgi:hypothetical protein